MNKQTLQNTFRKWKKEAKADYAITNPDGLGDCNSCVNWTLSNKYGDDSLGIWSKQWTRGMNAGLPYEESKSAIIAHDITEEQAETFYEVFGEHYNITPQEYNPSKCFTLYEKDTPVYSVSYYDKEFDRSYVTSYAGFEDAQRRFEFLESRGFKPTIERLF